MALLHAYITGKTRLRVFPYGFPDDQFKRYTVVDIMTMREDLYQLLATHALDWKSLTVVRTPSGNARILYKGASYGDYLNVINRRYARNVVYTT